MFWKLIRWGGTAVVLVLVLAAAFISTQHEPTAAPAQPAGAEQQTNKNFNF
ncbi:hypothetical protein HF313_22695 [Massilia atriviolacea]|uniref:hypothetical protein n=1 Tax=Massilia atriviolacea TaxID=2495579 RepID=UPI0013E0993E|nr:hypothetical protein [Massilia atriviolacea]